MAPVVGFNSRIGGRPPDVIENVYPGTPPLAMSAELKGVPTVPVVAGQASEMAGGGVNSYATVTAPDDVATVPCVTRELTATLKAAAYAAAEMPPDALAVPVGTAPEDWPPVTVKVRLAGDHVTPGGPPGTKVTITVFGPGLLPN